MISRFFIYRPIFATVLSIVFMLVGGLALISMPIAQYPEMAPPTVQVSATYPGASAEVIARTLASPLEQEVNGVEGMIYMKSRSSGSGTYTLEVTFEPGINLDIATVQIQNRVSIASPRLPEDVRRQGIKTEKKASNFALAISLVSEEKDGKAVFDELFLQNYGNKYVNDVLKRIYGVGSIMTFGAEDYSMRVWLDPNRLQERMVTTTDVLNAIREQNVQVAAGVVGADPAPAGTAFQYTVTTRGRLTDPRQFENIIVKVGEKGGVLRLKDLAKVELGAKNYYTYSKLNGKPAATTMVYQLPGANLVEISKNAKKTMEVLAKDFPEGMRYEIAYNASDVIDASIAEIIETLLIATVLVILTVLIFLQDWRSTLIPSVTIPVSLIGTFFVLSLLGFSINTLTLFGLVLAIGIVVDDAIVVVENVARNINEEGLAPREATLKAMEEVTGPVIATTLVLLAVFVPTAFMGGVTGTMYNQFGLTIATAAVFSSINALTMSPALCAMLLRPAKKTRNPIYVGFNWVMDRVTAVYGAWAGFCVRKLVVTLPLFGVVLFGAYWGMVTVPGGFVPDEDQGYAMVNVQLPDAASAQRTRAVLEEIDAIVKKTPGIARNISIGGYSLIQSAGGSNLASNLIVFENWNDRTTPETHAKGIVAHLNREFSKIQEAIIMCFQTPAIPGFGNVSGFELMVQDRADRGPQALQNATFDLIGAGNSQAGLRRLYSGVRANVPQLFVDVDREKVKKLGVPLDQVFQTLQAYMGSAYANDFNYLGRTYQVNVQAEAKFRAHTKDIRRLRVRDQTGNMVPLGTLLQIDDSFGPMIVERYNLYPSATLNGSPGPGFSSGQAMGIIEDVAKQRLPQGFGYEWTGLSFQQILAGNQAPFIFALAVLLVYLVLAAQYESWGIPLAVIMAVPLGILGAMVSLMARQMDNNVYTQIGLILLIGLVCKNAILIVEFAKENREKGLSVVQSATEAARLRFRPILMTAISFIFGTLPLIIATGAGAGSRQALGTAVFGGMVIATFLGVFFTPALYAAVQGFSEWLGGLFGKPKPEASDEV
jgi:hydrophobe/amphiphile efflux-1 (HAE1) family protein